MTNKIKKKSSKGFTKKQRAILNRRLKGTGIQFVSHKAFLKLGKKK